MKTRSILIYLVFLNISLFAQSEKVIPAEIARYQKENTKFSSYSLFETIANRGQENRLQKIATDASIFSLNSQSSKQILEAKEQTIEISFPYKHENITVQLYKKDITSKTFTVVNEEHEVVDYQPGIHYRGIIKGEPNSLVAFSFFQDEVMGIASKLGEYGNIVVGKLQNDSNYISYSDNTLDAELQMDCHIDQLLQNEENMVYYTKAMSEAPTTVDKCLKINYVLAYDTYIANGRNVQKTADWMSAIQNNVSALYENEGITLEIEEIMVWTQQDPYTGDSEDKLVDFRNYHPYINGDIGHLVDLGSSGGIAYLNSLCRNYNHAYSGVNHRYQDIPTYSWTVMVLTHEMGHSFGSPHTHACTWNGDNTAIDGCGPVANTRYKEGTCPNGPLPTPQVGGTIMSYCHLLTNIGINLANGFGEQPAALIRQTVSNSPCVASTCDGTDCQNTISGLKVLEVTSDEIRIEIQDINTRWQIRAYEYTEEIIPAWKNIYTEEYEYLFTDLKPNTYYIIEVRNRCNDNTIESIQKLILTDGDYCKGEYFYDTGGEEGDYKNNEYFIKTFYPNVERKGITLSFEEFDIEEDTAFLKVYNGVGVQAPLFEDSILTGNLNADLPTFEADNPQGAITVEFYSEEQSSGSGWIGKITCHVLGVNDVEFKNIRIYPNPATHQISIDWDQNIHQIEIRDITGRVIRQESLNINHATYDISELSKGVYFMLLENNNTSKVVKWIKN